MPSTFTVSKAPLASVIALPTVNVAPLISVIVFVSPVSTSVSFVSTAIDWPVENLLTDALSATAVGASFTGVTTIEAVFVAVENAVVVPFVLVLFLVTFIDATVHDGYFIWADTYLQHVGVPGNWVMPVMSIGQIAEIGTMAVLGFFLKNLGWRKTMIIGILGHTVRFGVFALVPSMVPAVLVNIVHGICYAFFFATVYIFVDDYFPKHARTSAQGLFNFLILGFGPFVSRFVWPYLGGVVFNEGGKPVFSKLFLVPSGAALVAAILLFLFFHPPGKGPQETGPAATPH